MFGQFLYFLVILVIASLYPINRPMPTSAMGCAIGVVGMFLLFWLITRVTFSALIRQASHLTRWEIDIRRAKTRSRLSLLAIIFTVVDIHFFGVTAQLARWPLFQWAPTLVTAATLFLFVANLCLVWATEYLLQEDRTPTRSARRIYISNQARLVLPAALPWFAISLGVDILYQVPNPQVQSVIRSTGGTIGILVVFLAVTAVISPVLIRRFWRCRPLSDRFVRQRISDLCDRAGVRIADIYLWPLFGSSGITAGVMGLVGRFRYLLVTEGLLHYLNDEELDSVVAHEIGHVAHHHLLIYTFAIVGFMGVSMAWVDAISLWVTTRLAFQSLLRFVQLSDTAGDLIAYGSIMVVMLVVFFRYVFGYFMRHFERQADLHVYKLMPSALPLVRTMEKIARITGISPTRPNWHHFSIAQRIDFLVQTESNRSLADHYHRSLRHRVAALFLSMTLLVSSGVYYHQSDHYFHMTIRPIEIKLSGGELSPTEQSGLLWLKGHRFYERGNHVKAIQAWSDGVQLAPDNPRLLNSLAWVFVTAEDISLRNPPRALALSEHAAALQPDTAAILDTLAEARFAMGDRLGAVESALAAKKRADVEMAPVSGSVSPDYYQQQLERFRSSPLPRIPKP